MIRVRLGPGRIVTCDAYKENITMLINADIIAYTTLIISIINVMDYIRHRRVMDSI